MSDVVIRKVKTLAGPASDRRDQTEGERAIRATIAGAILGILLTLLGRGYPEK